MAWWLARLGAVAAPSGPLACGRLRTPWTLRSRSRRRLFQLASLARDGLELKVLMVESDIRAQLEVAGCLTVEDDGGDIALLSGARSLCIPLAVCQGGVALAVPGIICSDEEPDPYSEAIEVPLAQEGSWEVASGDVTEVRFVEIG